jgi:GAF domain-containing protein
VPAPPEVRLKHSDSLVQNLPVPLAIVTQSGDVVDFNRAFAELAERCWSKPSLSEMLGAAFTRVLSRAWIERHIQSTAPLLVGPEPRETFRLSFMSTTDDKTLGVMLQDVTAELDCRRMLAERDRDFAVLRDVGVGLSSLLELEALALRTYEAARRAIPSKNIYIAIYDRETQTVSFPRYQEDGEWKEMTARPFGKGLTEHLLTSGEPLLLDDDVETRAKELGIEPVGRPCRAWVGAPMVVDGESIGVIALQDYETAGVYDQHDLEVLTIIAAQAAAGIKNARSLDAERRAFRELSEAQQRMLETERLRGVTETVGALNHEINNPLSAIAGNSQLLMRKPAGIPVDALRKIEAIHDAARRIQRVTAKMSSLIQACSMPYPGNESILDVERSLARKDEGEATDTAAAPKAAARKSRRAA